MAKPVLLLVESNEEVLKQIQRDLERRYGKRYRTVKAKSAGEALETLRRLKEENEPVALVLADQKLPDVSGVGFLEQASVLCPQAKRGLLATFNDVDAQTRFGEFFFQHQKTALQP